MKQLKKENLKSLNKQELKEKKERIDSLCDAELIKFVKKMRSILKKEQLSEVMDANITFKWILKE